MVALLVGGVLSWTDTTRVADRRAGPPGQLRSSPRQLPVIVESVGSRETHRSFLARPSIRARAGILIELSTGAVLFEKQPDQPRPIASLTKIMTALLVLARDPHLSGTVPISPRAARQDPIDVGLAMGKRVKVRDLMYGQLLRSGNDAAVALAEYVSGSVPRFLHLMNARARELGLEHTRFATPNGLSDKGYSTAREVAILARAALQDERYADPPPNDEGPRCPLGQDGGSGPVAERGMQLDHSGQSALAHDRQPDAGSADADACRHATAEPQRVVRRVHVGRHERGAEGRPAAHGGSIGRPARFERGRGDRRARTASPAPSTRA